MPILKDNIIGNITTATKLETARTINGVSFDGTANITVTDSTKAPLASPALTGTPTAPTAAAGTNNTQIATTAFVANAVTSSVPVSTIIAIADGVVPTGFLEYNGATISRSTYSGLFSKIGTLYGAGDGSTTFKIPDLRGEFIRGFDNGRGVDSGRTIGSSQAGAYESHTHTGSTNSTGDHIHTVPKGEGYASGTSQYFGNSSATSAGTRNTGSAGAHSHTVTIGASGSTETRPRNIAMMFCIKY